MGDPKALRKAGESDKIRGYVMAIVGGDGDPDLSSLQEHELRTLCGCLAELLVDSMEEADDLDAQVDRLKAGLYIALAEEI